MKKLLILALLPLAAQTPVPGPGLSGSGGGGGGSAITSITSPDSTLTPVNVGSGVWSLVVNSALVPEYAVAGTFTAPQTIPLTAGQFYCDNNASAGTTNGLLVSFASDGKCTKTAASATSGVIGVAVSGGGTTGQVLVTNFGTANVTTDNATTAGDYLVASSTAGKVHAQTTRPTSGQILGRVASTNGGAGTYSGWISLENVGGGGIIANWTSTTGNLVVGPFGYGNGFAFTGNAVVNLKYCMEFTAPYTATVNKINTIINTGSVAAAGIGDANCDPLVQSATVIGAGANVAFALASPYTITGGNVYTVMLTSSTVTTGGGGSWFTLTGAVAGGVITSYQCTAGSTGTSTLTFVSGCTAKATYEPLATYKLTN